MDFFRSLQGMVTLELTSADPMGFLRLASVPVQDVEKISDLQLRFRATWPDARRLLKLARKRGEELRICRREGLRWVLRKLLRRPVLVLGLSLLLGVSLWVPGRVFFIRVEGNQQVPSAQITEKAQQCGIGFGALRRQVRSEKLKNALLSAMPQLQWAGVNTYGCVAVITVRERDDPPREDADTGVSSILAVRDGIIREMTVLQGNALVKPGQAVKAGQVLISGYTDCGICIQATRARGEIYALTQRELSALYPTNYAFRQLQTASDKKLSIIIGKKRINFAKDSGISGGSCAKIVNSYQLTLPGGFALPVWLELQQVLSYRPLQLQAQQESVLQDFADGYIRNRMVAGRIETAGHVYTQLTDAYRLDAIYSCYEMIGIYRKEESLTDHD